MGFGSSFYDVIIWALGIVNILMYGIVCCLCIYVFTQSFQKKVVVSYKVMIVLMSLYTMLQCLLTASSLSRDKTFYNWLNKNTYIYLDVTSYELSFWFICFLYLSVYIEILPLELKR